MELYTKERYREAETTSLTLRYLILDLSKHCGIVSATEGIRGETGIIKGKGNREKDRRFPTLARALL